MRSRAFIGLLTILLFLACPPSGAQEQDVRLDFYGDTLHFNFDRTTVPAFSGPLTQENIQAFYEQISTTDYAPVLNALLAYKQQHRPDDWLYYQLIRRAAQYACPKKENYDRYTLYKWFLLVKSGYDAILAVSGDRMLFYVQSEENIYNIPHRVHDGKKYVCLNYHDYGNIDFEKNRFEQVALDVPEARYAFSYKLTQLPDFRPEDYQEKNLEFSYQDVTYRFRVKLNPQVKNIFANYPVTDYQVYFNAPMSNETYRSLIPQLKEQVHGMSTQNGVAYLMRFTRYAFIYQSDMKSFGGEKRLSPEQTLLYGESDCEDRAALFFYLVREIYNLPMIVLAFPQHVAIAVKFDKPVGKPILFNGSQYSVCEPTPQKKDLPIGKLSKELSAETYEVAYVYNP